ncbi:MAG: DUF3341 domain-containing protein [Elusimicrobia bacterium]|nr:DUF3341 domain-containing protein [Elusimicrobiota bacterium]
MKTKNMSAFGIYTTRTLVEGAIERLRSDGFDNASISVLFPENLGTRDLALEKHTKAPEGTAAGAGSGAIIGGTLGWLAGIGVLSLPGFGPLIAAGPIMAALAGLGVGGGVGGVLGALAGMGIPEYEAKRFTGRIREGGILLSVHCGDSHDVARAKDMLRLTGAQDIAVSREATARHERPEAERTVLR